MHLRLGCDHSHLGSLGNRLGRRSFPSFSLGCRLLLLLHRGRIGILIGWGLVEDVQLELDERVLLPRLERDLGLRVFFLLFLWRRSTLLRVLLGVRFLSLVLLLLLLSFLFFFLLILHLLEQHQVRFDVWFPLDEVALQAVAAPDHVQLSLPLPLSPHELSLVHGLVQACQGAAALDRPVHHLSIVQRPVWELNRALPVGVVPLELAL